MQGEPSTYRWMLLANLRQAALEVMVAKATFIGTWRAEANAVCGSLIVLRQLVLDLLLLLLVQGLWRPLELRSRRGALVVVGITATGLKHFFAPLGVSHLCVYFYIPWTGSRQVAVKRFQSRCDGTGVGATVLSCSR